MTYYKIPQCVSTTTAICFVSMRSNNTVYNIKYGGHMEMYTVCIQAFEQEVILITSLLSRICNFSLPSPPLSFSIPLPCIFTFSNYTSDFRYSSLEDNLILRTIMRKDTGTRESTMLTREEIVNILLDRHK